MFSAFQHFSISAFQHFSISALIMVGETPLATLPLVYSPFTLAVSVVLTTFFIFQLLNKSDLWDISGGNIKYSAELRCNVINTFVIKSKIRLSSSTVGEQARTDIQLRPNVAARSSARAMGSPSRVIGYLSSMFRA